MESVRRGRALLLAALMVLALGCAGAGVTLAAGARAGTGATGATGPTGSTGSAALTTLGLATASDTWGAGFGAVRPATISYNGDPTSYIKRIHWSSWGGAKAAGTGTAGYTWPGFAVADGTRYVKATVVAYDLGSCDGHPAYRRVVWYFPQYEQSFVAASAGFDICSGKSLSINNSLYNPVYCHKGSYSVWVAGGVHCSALAGIVAEVGASAHRGHSAMWQRHGWICGTDLNNGVKPQSVNCTHGNYGTVNFTI